jgi:hypothetical protein
MLGIAVHNFSFLLYKVIEVVVRIEEARQDAQRLRVPALGPGHPRRPVVPPVPGLFLLPQVQHALVQRAPREIRARRQESVRGTTIVRQHCISCTTRVDYTWTSSVVFGAAPRSRWGAAHGAGADQAE